MNFTPSQAPLLSPVLQRLTQVKVTGQKTRTRDPERFPSMLAKLCEETTPREAMEKIEEGR